jgi:hypothetical protein
VSVGRESKKVVSKGKKKHKNKKDKNFRFLCCSIFAFQQCQKCFNLKWCKTKFSGLKITLNIKAAYFYSVDKTFKL